MIFMFSGYDGEPRIAALPDFANISSVLWCRAGLRTSFSMYILFVILGSVSLCMFRFISFVGLRMGLIDSRGAASTRVVALGDLA